MKYSHIIYNSSEHNQGGGVGFGVRSMTEGTPDQLPSLLEQNGVFSFEETGASVSSSALAANPEIIKGVVPVYFFRVLNMSDNRKAYILGRKIAVGFDYTFYLNGKPGRLGNYVVDAYVFGETPTAREFEIFLENAAAGSNHFIPASPVPTIDNEEMREISTGHKPTLPAEEKPFEAKERPGVSSQAIDLLFAFIQSRKEGKPLLVKADVATPPGLMAQLARLVPQNEIPELTFLTNHSEEGKKQGINIVFINEHYAFEVFRKQWVMIDLTAGEKIQTTESDVFRQAIESAIAKGDFESVRKLTGWCLSEMYEKGKECVKETQQQLYNYVHNYEEFALLRMAEDEQLRTLLNGHFQAHPEEKRRLDASLQEWYDSLESLPMLWDWMEFVMKVKPVDCGAVVDNNRGIITNCVFETPETFREFKDRFAGNIQEALKFIDLSAFPAHNAYLSGLGKDWERYYRLFLSDKLDNKEYLLNRMVGDIVADDVLERVMAKEIGNPERCTEVMTALLMRGNVADENKVLLLLIDRLPQLSPWKYDFFTLFADRREDARYASLFIWQLEGQGPRTKDDLLKHHTNLMSFLATGQGVRWDKGKKEMVVNRLESAIKRCVMKGELTRKEGADMSQKTATVCDPLLGERFRLLEAALLEKMPTDGKKAVKLWNIAKDLEDRKYLRQLAPFYLTSLETEERNRIQGECDYVLKEGLMSHEELLTHALKSGLPLFYLIGMMKSEGGKPQEQLDFLVAEAGYPDERAMELLEKYFPESHRKIVKSRQPSVGTKIASAFKGMFGGGRNKK